MPTPVSTVSFLINDGFKDSGYPTVQVEHGLGMVMVPMVPPSVPESNTGFNTLWYPKNGRHHITPAETQGT
jgi:hypothetical protein